MPNTSVKLKSAIVGGLVAGLLFEAAKFGYAIYAAKAIKYSAIYGTLGAIPLFILWIYISWVLILIGAVVSFSLENLGTYMKEEKALLASQKVKELLAIRIMVEVAGAYGQGKTLPEVDFIAHKLEVPVRLVRHMVEILLGAGLLFETTLDNTRCYVPGSAYQVISVRQVREAVKNYSGVEIIIKEDQEMKRIKTLIEKARKVEREVLSLATLDTLISSKDALK